MLCRVGDGRGWSRGATILVLNSVKWRKVVERDADQAPTRVWAYYSELQSGVHASPCWVEILGVGFGFSRLASSKTVCSGSKRGRRSLQFRLAWEIKYDTSAIYFFFLLAEATRLVEH